MVRLSLRLILVACLLATTPLLVPAQNRMPQLKFTDRTLANGLRVITVEDHSSPTVAIQVWYHVGSKDDPNQRSGLRISSSTSCSRVRRT
jgi:zinc protease